MWIPIVKVECPEYVPAAEVVHDLDERLLLVGLNVVQGLAALVEVLDLPLDTVVLKQRMV